MTTTITKTVKSAGGDYSSLSAWEAAQQGNLTVLDEIHEAQCFGFVDTTAVTIDGWTTDATRYIRVFADPSAVATLPYTTSGYRLEMSGAQPVVMVFEEYTRIERITVQATVTAGSNCGGMEFSGAATSDMRAIGCLVRGVMNGSNPNGQFGFRVDAGTAKFINCVALDYTDTGGSPPNPGFYTSGGTLYAYNCLTYNCRRGYRQDGGTFIAKNCLYDRGAQTTHEGFVGVFDAASDYNASTEADAVGTHARNSQTFTYVNTGTGDFHLTSSDAGARDFGVDLSADSIYAFAVDFDNVSRPQGSAWDIGATEAAASGFDAALMAAMDRPRPDIVFDLPQMVASGMAPSDRVNP